MLEDQPVETEKTEVEAPADAPAPTRRDGIAGIYEQLEARETEAEKAKAAPVEPAGSKKPVVVSLKPNLGAPVAAKPGVAKPGEATSVVAGALKPPANWRAPVREKWGALPPEVQAEVLRTEKEYQANFRSNAEYRKSMDGLSKAIAPYEQMIRGEGSNPEVAVATLLQTAYALRSAPLGVKAATAAKIIKDYGLASEEGIGLLAKALDGQPVPNGQRQPQQRPQEFRDARLDGILKEAEAARTEKATGELDKFWSDHEFEEELWPLMEKVLSGGLTTSLESAYKMAATAHPDVSSVLEQRQKAKLSETAKAATTRAKAASVTVRSHPVGKVAPARQGEANTRRDKIREIYESLEAQE